MQDPLTIVITGRVMLALSHHGLMDPRRLAIYVAAVCDAVHKQQDSGAQTALEDLIDGEITLLERALASRLATSPTTARSPDGDDEPVAESPERPPDAAGRKRHGPLTVPVSRTMEQKLKEDRKPVQKLLAEDCVAAGLLDPDKARSLVAGMAGKQPEDAEREIVEYLREVLLQQVKHCIRKFKGGPWAAPRVQADLRNDIHHAQTVRGVLMLARQMIEERREWEAANGRGGILGLFAGRH